MTLRIGGYDICVINRMPSVFLGIKPIGEHLKFEIGRLLNGLAILRATVSDSTFSLAASGLAGQNRLQMLNQMRT